MSYISATTINDDVIVWERDENGRQYVPYTAPYMFYVDDPDGKHKTIYGNSVTRILCTNEKDFESKKHRFQAEGFTLYETDIEPHFRVLSQAYYGKPAPKLHITFFDIEVNYDPALGFSSIDNPYAEINSVSLFHEWSKQLVVFAVPPEAGWTEERLLAELKTVVPDAPIPEEYNMRIVLCRTEAELLMCFLQEIEDSDVICGWNSDMFDTPYVGKRIEKKLGKRHLGLLDFPEVKQLPWFRPVYSRKIRNKDGSAKVIGTTLELRGRVRTDYMDLYKKYEPGERASYKLGSIEQEVGLNLPKLEYEGTLHDLYKNNFAFFIRYNIRDTEILHGFEQVLGYVELANQMYHISTGLFKHVSGTIKLVEQSIINYCHHVLHQVVPNGNTIDEDRTIDGALVLYPQVSLQEYTGSIDINSLYPTAIRSINISPETLRGQFDEFSRAITEIHQKSFTMLTLRLEDGEIVVKEASEFAAWLREKKWSISGYGTVFDQNVHGIIPTILAGWYTQRKEYQKLMKDALTQGDKETANYYDRLQYVYKIKLNSTYGALTNINFRFFDLRMGESVTATGRMILRHQCRKVAEFLDGDYNVDFPQYETVKDCDEANNKRGVPHELALNGPKFNGNFMTESVIYGDTDSTYFKTHVDNVRDAVRVADRVALEVNNSYKPFVQEYFLCNPEFDDLVKCGRELVTDKGIFVDKKRYILHIVDKEGKPSDSMKVMGLDTKKTTLPRHIGAKLNSFIEMFLKGTPWSEVAELVVDYKDELRAASKKDITLIGLPKGIQNMEDYQDQYKRFGDSVRLPGHVAAAVHYNLLLKQYNDRQNAPIMSGMKIKVFYLNQTYGKFHSIALPTDIEVVPQWFLENFTVDIDSHIERLIDDPLQNIIKAIGKRTPTRHDLMVEDVFGF